MKNLVTFASDLRLNALLCCSVTVLLTACGGGLTDAGNGQPAQTAAITTRVDEPAANGAAEAPNSVDATAAQATEAASGNFELTGYDANPLAASTADATAQDSATAPATSADGAPPPAGDGDGAWTRPRR